MISHICKNCNKKFFSRHSITQYCSVKCGAAKRIKGINKDCKACGKKFWAFKYKLDEGKGFFCSINCYHKDSIGKHAGENSVHWKEENLGYIGIHLWLKKYFGNPPSCEMCGIEGYKLNNRWYIEWAKLKGKEYDRKRENFWGLCKKCHSTYDLTEEKAEQLRKLNIDRFKIKT